MSFLKNTLTTVCNFKQFTDAAANKKYFWNLVLQSYISEQFSVLVAATWLTV